MLMEINFLTLTDSGRVFLFYFLCFIFVGYEKLMIDHMVSLSYNFYNLK